MSNHAPLSQAAQVALRRYFATDLNEEIKHTAWSVQGILQIGYGRGDVKLLCQRLLPFLQLRQPANASWLERRKKDWQTCQSSYANFLNRTFLTGETEQAIRTYLLDNLPERPTPHFSAHSLSSESLLALFELIKLLDSHSFEEGRQILEAAMGSYLLAPLFFDPVVAHPILEYCVTKGVCLQEWQKRIAKLEADHMYMWLILSDSQVHLRLLQDTLLRPLLQTKGRNLTLYGDFVAFAIKNMERVEAVPVFDPPPAIYAMLPPDCSDEDVQVVSNIREELVGRANITVTRGTRSDVTDQPAPFQRCYIDVDQSLIYVTASFVTGIGRYHAQPENLPNMSDFLDLWKHSMKALPNELKELMNSF